MPRLTFTGRPIVRREKDRCVRFDALGEDLVAAGYSAIMKLRLTQPGLSPASAIHALTMVSGDNYAVEIDGTEDVFPVVGTYSARIYADGGGGEAEPEVATEEFPIYVV